MDAKLMQDFNDSLSVINKWNDGAIVINSLELHASIRVLDQLSYKQDFIKFV